jgi:7-cyano-7-deazaguanine synthase in queuosine biosynthesis
MINGISILFSGGADSTLAALIALERAEHIHLLTFHQSTMGKIGKHRKVVREMRQIFGEDRIRVHEENIDTLFKRFYTTGMTNRIFRYRTFYIPWICGACKLAMHIAAIRYNHTHNLRITYDGANFQSAPYFVDQTVPYIEVIKRLYQSYNMEYDCPVMNVVSSDRETTKYGLSITANTKRQHVIYTTQHTCLNGLLVHAHARLYYRLFRGKSRTGLLGAKFLMEVLDECKSLIPRE